MFISVPFWCVDIVGQASYNVQYTYVHSRDITEKYIQKIYVILPILTCPLGVWEMTKGMMHAWTCRMSTELRLYGTVWNCVCSGPWTLIKQCHVIFLQHFIITYSDILFSNTTTTHDKKWKCLRKCVVFVTFSRLKLKVCIKCVIGYYQGLESDTRWAHIHLYANRQ